jgi:hypothetical protein
MMRFPSYVLCILVLLPLLVPLLALTLLCTTLAVADALLGMVHVDLLLLFLPLLTAGHC